MDILEARKKAKKKKKDTRRVKEVEKKVEVEEKASSSLLAQDAGETSTALPPHEEGRTDLESSVDLHEEVIQDEEKEETFMELAEEALGAALEKKEEKQFLTFSIGEELFAVEIENIREIIRPRQVTPVPGVDRVILGITSVRGNIMPVVDVALKIGMRSEPFGPEKWDRSTRFITFAFNRVTVAAVVESVKGVISAYADEVEPTPTTSRTTPKEYVKGIIRKERDIYSVINLKDVFDFLFLEETK